MGTFGVLEDKSGIRQAVRNWNARKTEPFPRRQPTKFFHVFNVGPFTWTRALGDMGTHIIKACQPDEEFAADPIVVPEFIFRHYEAGNQQLNYREYEGFDVARDILGTLPPSQPGNDLTRFGVFMSESNPPKKKELEAAQEVLLKTCQELCFEGDTAWAGDDASRQFIRNSNMHKVAARVAGHEAEWCVMPRARVTCPVCGGLVIKGAAIHAVPECGAILDRKKAEQYGLIAKEEKSSKVI